MPELTVFGVVEQAVGTFGDVLGLFTQQPLIYVTGLMLLGGVIGGVRRLVRR